MKLFFYLYDVEELRHHSRYSPKERRPTSALHLVPVSFHFDERALLLGDALDNPRWIDLIDSRREYSRWFPVRVDGLEELYVGR
jgi:hypothetical protein